MERHRIKRVPIVRDGKVIGMLSRANLLQGLLAREPLPAGGPISDEALRGSVSGELARHSWSAGVTHVVVDSGVVHLWGRAASPPAKEAARVAVENVPGVKRVVNNLVVLPVEAYFPS